MPNGQQPFGHTQMGLTHSRPAHPELATPSPPTAAPQLPPRQRVRPTDAELEILHALWGLGPSTVRQVQQVMPGPPRRGYTTVLKLLQIMTTKGLVERDETARAHVYSASRSKTDTQRELTADLLERAFSGSAGKLVLQALSSHPATADELIEIRRLLDDLQG